MEELIKWIIENKELLLLGCIAISVPISMHFGRTIINNIEKNNTTNNYGTDGNDKEGKSKGKNDKRKNSKKKKGQKKVELTQIRLYSTGKKGKVYTTNFYKMINHNFGVEITLKNNTSTLQNVKVGWCIYKDGRELINGAFNKSVSGKSSLTTDFYVKEQDFNNLKPGKYKSQFWVNDKRVQKVYFKILNK